MARLSLDHGFRLDLPFCAACGSPVEQVRVKSAEVLVQVQHTDTGPPHYRSSGRVTVPSYARMELDVEPVPPTGPAKAGTHFVATECVCAICKRKWPAVALVEPPQPPPTEDDGKPF